MKHRIIFIQLFLRLTIATACLSAVADRFGLWGIYGIKYVDWGNWLNFLKYANSVNSYAGKGLGNVLAIIATLLEIVMPLLLLVGYKIEIASIASGILMLLFASAMTYSFGIKPSLNYSVWTSAAACFALTSFSQYFFCLDNLLKNKFK